MTRQCIFPTVHLYKCIQVLKYAPTFTHYFSVRQIVASFDRPYASNFNNSKLWCRQSQSFQRSTRTSSATYTLLSTAFSQSSITLRSVVLQPQPDLKANKKGWKIYLKYSINCWYMALSKHFETTRSMLTGLEFSASNGLFSPFYGTTCASLRSLGNSEFLIGILISLVIG